MEKREKIKPELQAKVLIAAIPYIQKYTDKIIVVKYGGNAMTNDELKDAVMEDMVLLDLLGIKIVLVHGGGPEINDMLVKLDIKSKFINGLRYTDEKTMDIVQMVLAGKVNKELVQLICQHKGKGIGLCGLDGNMLVAKKKKTQSGDDLGFVGDIVKVNTEPILDIIENGGIPIIATIATDEEGNTYNINSDTAASKIASALKAENLVIMTDVRGLLKDKNDENTLISEVNIEDVPNLIKGGIISGGMIPKIECCVEAVKGGVKKSVIIDGRIPHSILIEMFSNEGIGTLFKSKNGK